MTTVPGMKLSFSMFNPLKNWDEGVVGVWCVCFFKMCLTMFNPPPKMVVYSWKIHPGMGKSGDDSLATHSWDVFVLLARMNKKLVNYGESWDTVTNDGL